MFCLRQFWFCPGQKSFCLDRCIGHKLSFIQPPSSFYWIASLKLNLIFYFSDGNTLCDHDCTNISDDKCDKEGMMFQIQLLLIFLVFISWIECIGSYIRIKSEAYAKTFLISVSLSGQSLSVCSLVCLSLCYLLLGCPDNFCLYLY